MSTWWKAARRADLGLSEADLPCRPFAVTNRGWYALHRLMAALGARNADLMAERDAFVPTQLAQHWGALIVGADLGKWVQVGWFDGRAVVAAGIAPLADATRLGDLYELSPLAGTPIGDWFQGIGQELAATSTGLLISGKPRTEGNTMTVNLTKGGKVDLTKEAGGTLSRVLIGLGWDVRKTAGDAYDLDASVIGLGPDGNCVGQDWFVYYNNKTGPGNAVVHHGDNLTGTGTGDDEQVTVDLAAVPAAVTELAVAVTIYDAKARKQTFGQVDKAFMRVADEATGMELARYDLTEDTEPGVNCLVFGKLYRKDTGWSFRAIGDGFTDELAGLVNAYKIG